MLGGGAGELPAGAAQQLLLPSLNVPKCFLSTGVSALPLASSPKLPCQASVFSSAGSLVLWNQPGFWTQTVWVGIQPRTD